MVDTERPRFLGPALADAITGIYAAYGVLGALLERSRTGTGRLVEVSMLEAMTHFAVEPFAAFFALGETPTSTRPAAARAGLHPAHRRRAPDRHTPVLAREVLARSHDRDRFASGWSAIGASTRGCRGSRTTRSSGRELDEYFAEQPLSHWAERLGENDVPFAPINPVDKVVEDPQVRHLGIVVPVQGAHGGAAAVRPPIQFDGERANSVRTAPLLDEHGAA